MLDGAEALLVEGAQRLNLSVSLLRKHRSVGIVPQTATIYEVGAGTGGGQQQGGCAEGRQCCTAGWSAARI